MNRRALLSLIGATTAASLVRPFAARAQQRAMPVIGFLASGSPEPSASIAAAFRKGLSEIGYTEGRNVAIEYRWAHNDFARIPELAMDLVRRNVSVIVIPANPAATREAKTLTTSIPIVFSAGIDAVQAGLVASLNRPGGNVTGVTSMNVELTTKRLALMQELLPQARNFAVLMNPGSRGPYEPMLAELRAAASAGGHQLEVLTARTEQDYEAVFATLTDKRADALLVSPGSPFNERRERLVALAARHALPTIYASREFAVLGGLISYGGVLADEFRLVGIYAGRILKGDKPAELPVMRAAKFEFVLNLKTARALTLDVPTSILLRADEVLE